MPSVTRTLGSFVTIGSAVYYSGGGYSPTPGDPALLEVYYGPAIAPAASPTPSPTSAPTATPTYAPCAVAAPTNGNLGWCTSALALGAQCQPTCNTGYGVSGPMDCSATGVLTATSVCETKQWASRNGLPTSSINSGQSCAAIGALLYVYTQPAFQKYAAATDAWEAGACRVPPALGMSHASRLASSVVPPCGPVQWVASWLPAGRPDVACCLSHVAGCLCVQ
jgi:hypothetical protein